MSKNSIFFLLAFLSFQFSNAQDTLVAPPQIIEVTVLGKSYTANQNFPSEIVGEYFLKKTGRLMNALHPNGKGYFYTQGSLKPVTYWVVINNDGTLFKDIQLDGNYFVKVIYRFDNETLRSKEGEYEMTEIRIAFDQMHAILFQDRYHKFK